MAERLFGIETEYAITGLDSNGAALSREAVLRRLMQLACVRVPHLFDATGRGIFLSNGARFYIDYPDHPEFSTPEVSNPSDVVRYQLAGDRLLTELGRELVLKKRRVADAVILRCNVDYGGTGATWGCHESYLHQTDPRVLPAQIIPFLVSRVIFTGAGGFNSRFLHGIQFTLSPRVWHLEHEISEQSTSARGIFHTKDETLSSDGYHRLHLLCGESLCSEVAAWLKVGSTALVVALIDAGLQPGDAVRLRDPLGAMRRIASDPTCRNTVEMHTGEQRTALAIQHHYLSVAEANAKRPFMPPWAPEVCRRWRVALERLEGAPDTVVTELDWAIKLPLYQRHARRRGVAWESLPHWNHVVAKLGEALGRSGRADKRPLAELILDANSRVAPDVKQLTPYLRVHGLSWDGLAPFVRLRQELFQIDARFGQLGDTGIFAALDRAGVLTHRVEGVDNIEHAMTHPPAIGRAQLRGEVVRELTRNARRYVCDWRGVGDCDKQRWLDLSDPFATNVSWQPWTLPEADLQSIRLRLCDGIDLS